MSTASGQKWHRNNPEKHRERVRRWKAANPEKVKKFALGSRLKKYGLSVDDYEEMLALQSGVCAICQRPERIPNRSLAVDHDHVSKTIRGLLCFDCNAALGKLEANLERVNQYLRGERVSPPLTMRANGSLAKPSEIV